MRLSTKPERTELSLSHKHKRTRVWGTGIRTLATRNAHAIFLIYFLLFLPRFYDGESHWWSTNPFSGTYWFIRRVIKWIHFIAHTQTNEININIYIYGYTIKLNFFNWKKKNKNILFSSFIRETKIKNLVPGRRRTPVRTASGSERKKAHAHIHTRTHTRAQRKE